MRKLPSIIKDTEFDKKGFAKTKNGILVPAYIGSQMGFNYPGRRFLDNEFYPKMKSIGVLPLCPFTSCAEYLDFSKLDDDMSLKEYKAFWKGFNQTLGKVNCEILMPHSKFMVAIFDGSHASDDGLCAEVGYYAEKHGPVVGIRSDFRLAENIEANINAAVKYFIKDSLFFSDQDNAYSDAYAGIEKLVKKIKRSA